MRFPVSGSVNARGQRRLNRRAVLEALLRLGPTARHALASLTGLSGAAITRIVDELVAERLIAEVPAGSGSGEANGTAGRRAVNLDIDAGAAHVLSIYVGHRVSRAGVHDIRGRIIASVERRLDQSTAAEDALRELRAEAELLSRANGVDPGSVLGLGVGVTAPVDDDGVVLHHPIEAWRGVRARDILARESEYPVVVDRVQRGMATAEAWFGAGINKASVAVVLVSDVIGCGFYIQGMPVRGADFLEGQLGHIRLPNGTRYCDVCRRVGCIDADLSDEGIAEAARQRLRLADLQDGTVDVANDVAVVRRLHLLSRAGHDGASRIVKERASAIGYALALVTGILNPELLLLAGGTVLDGWDVMRDEVTAGIHANSPLPFLQRKSEIGLTHFGPSATLVGAVSLVLRPFYASGGIRMSNPEPGVEEHGVVVGGKPRSQARRARMVQDGGSLT